MSWNVAMRRYKCCWGSRCAMQRHLRGRGKVTANCTKLAQGVAYELASLDEKALLLS